MDIIGISEGRWVGSGMVKERSGHTVIHSGREDNHHTEGVAIIMSDKAAKALLEWKPPGERLIMARFNSNYTKLTVITCYTPIEDAEEVQKDVFYDQLQQAIQEVPSHDVLCVIGDFNARVGNDNEGREKIMGKNGCGNINDNGRRLCDLCVENNLAIGGTLFPHREIHKMTWTSPDGKIHTQIDHVIINSKWKNSLLDVKARRGADVGGDHQLLMSTLAIKLRKTKRGKESAKRIDAAKLKVPEIKAAFQLELRNRLQALEEEPGEHDLSNFHQTVREAGEVILGFRRRKKEEWIQQGTWDKITERKQMKEKINSTRSERVKDRCRKKYRELDKEVNKGWPRGTRRTTSRTWLRKQKRLQDGKT